MSPLSSLWVSRTGSASDWCALQEALYKCIDTIQYNKCIDTIQFLLRQAFADDEASTRLLQILLFLLLSTASLMFIPCAVRSSLSVFLCFLFHPLVRIALLPVVCFHLSLLRARTTSPFFFLFFLPILP